MQSLRPTDRVSGRDTPPHLGQSGVRRRGSGPAGGGAGAGGVCLKWGRLSPRRWQFSWAGGAGRRWKGLPGRPGLRPQAPGNGFEGQDGGRECAEVEGGWPRNPFLPLLGARGGDCRGKPPLTGAAAAGGGASCAGLARGAGSWDKIPRRQWGPRRAGSGLIFPGGGRVGCWAVDARMRGSLAGAQLTCGARL